MFFVWFLCLYACNLHEKNMIFYSVFYLKFIFYSLSPQPPLKKFWIRTCNYLKTKIYSYIFVSLFSSFFHWQYLYKIKSNFNITDIILFLTWPWADQGFFTMDIKITRHIVSLHLLSTCNTRVHISQLETLVEKCVVIMHFMLWSFYYLITHDNDSFVDYLIT